MCSWAESYMAEGKGNRFCARYTDMIYRLDETFGREQCAFYDPSVKFGGPNPDESMTGMVAAKNPNAKNPTKSRRIRRSAADADSCDGLSEEACDNQAMDGLECSAEDRADRKLLKYQI